MQIICIHCTVFELYLKEKKERRTKLKFSHSILSTVRRINEILGVFYIRIAKSFIYETFALLCCVHLGAPPIP